MNLAGPDSATMLPGGDGGLPSITVHLNGTTGILRFEFMRRKNSGLVYQPLKSDDPANPASWTSLTDEPSVLSIDTQWERVIYEEPVDTGITPRCFGRVRVTLPP